MNFSYKRQNSNSFHNIHSFQINYQRHSSPIEHAKHKYVLLHDLRDGLDFVNNIHYIENDRYRVHSLFNTYLLEQMHLDVIKERFRESGILVDTAANINLALTDFC